MIRTERIQVSVSHDELKTIRVAAAIAGKSMSEYCRDAALEKAGKNEPKEGKPGKGSALACASQSTNYTPAAAHA